MATPRSQPAVFFARALRPLVRLCPLFLAGCGPEHALSGAWQQDCDSVEGRCDDEPFVYMLHVGRYGDDVTGLVVRYVNSGAPFDPRMECGCYVMQGGRAKDTSISLHLKLRAAPAAPGDGPGCPAPTHPFASESCRAALADPPCSTLRFDLSGDDDILDGRLSCDDAAPGVTRRFVPARGKTRRTCLAADHCANLPSPDDSPP